MSSQERAVAAYDSILKQPQTTAAIAQRTGLTYSGAWQMLCRISRIVPIYHDSATKTWRICKFDF